MNFPELFSTEELINVVIGTPKGSRNKFVYDEKGKYFKLIKVLPEGTSFPVDVGFLPDTKSGDGGPFEVFVYMEGLTYPGCVVECRAVGIIEIDQEAEGRKYRNDRIIAVPVASSDHENILEIKDVATNSLNELLNFCRYYNEFESKKFNIISIKGSRDAINAIKESK